jgi:hypothetical protein
MAAMPALSYAGASLAAPALAAKGLAAATPGIFSAATPALAGLPSAIPAATPGIFSAATPALGGLKSFAPLAQQGSTLAQVAPNLAGQNQVLQAFSQVPNKGVELAKVAELGKTGSATGDAISRAAGLAKETATPGLDAAVKGYATSPEYLAQANMARDAATASKVADAYAAQQAATGSPIIKGENFLSNLGNLMQNPSMDAAIDYAKEHPYATTAAGYGLYSAMQPKPKQPTQDKGMIRPYGLEVENLSGLPTGGSTAEQEQMRYTFTPEEPYKAAEGGIAQAYAIGGPVETMAAMNAVGANTGYPMAGINTPMYSNPMVQRPEAVNVISPSGDAGVSAYSGEPRFAGGGISDLGGYSDGGRLLKGPGDGVSDSIPAVIGNKQPARLADGEFVVPARIVSELGNGSTEAGARKLYAMMERVQKARRKSVGKGRVAVNSKADKHLPA